MEWRASKREGNGPTTTEGQSPRPKNPAGREGEREISKICASFFFIFLGAGAFQQFMVPYLMASTDWGRIGSSAVLATVYFSFLFWRVFVSYSMAALGEKASLVLGGATYTLFALALLFPHDFYAILAAAAVWGWGAASFWISSCSVVLDLSGAGRYGSASGKLYTATNVGQAIGVLALGLLIGFFGFRESIAFAVITSAVGNAASALTHIRGNVREKPNLWTITRMGLSGKGLVLGFLLFASSLGYGVLLGIFAEHVASGYGFLSLSLITLLFYLIRIPSSLVGGWVLDKFPRPAILSASFAAASASLVAIALSPNQLFLGAGALALGFQASLVPVASMAIVGDAARPERRHMALGAVYAWRDLGVALALIGGAAMRSFSGSLEQPFLFFGMAYGACAFLSFLLTKTSEM
ncbi:MAG: MFS transporter [Candidatus Brockarchaeota archaeon]|nr:MFS transporter [Candidatus Brockarchaeota archaeon]